MPLKPPPEGAQPLKRFRIEQRLAQHELAAKVGANQPTISMLETGLAVPSRLVLARLCRVLNTRPEQLFTRPILDEVARRMKAQG